MTETESDEEPEKPLIRSDVPTTNDNLWLNCKILKMTLKTSIVWKIILTWLVYGLVPSEGE